MIPSKCHFPGSDKEDEIVEFERASYSPSALFFTFLRGWNHFIEWPDFTTFSFTDNMHPVFECHTIVHTRSDHRPEGKSILLI